MVTHQYLPELVEPFFLTVRIAILTIISHLVLGTIFGYILSNKKFRFRGILDGIITLPMIFPPVVAGFWLLLLFGKNGPLGHYFEIVGINIVFSLWGVFAGSFISGLPLVVKPIQAAIDCARTSLVEGSLALGASEHQTFFFVVLPSIKKQVFTGVILGLGRSLGEVGITLVLGGNIIGKTETVSLAIYNSIFDGNYQKAVVLSLTLGLLSLLMFWSLRYLAD